MLNKKYSYFIYPAAVGIFLAWAVTGYFYSSPESEAVHEKKRIPSGMENRMPDMRLIEQKNIFGADTAGVKSTLDSVGFIPSSGEEGSASAPQSSPLRLIGLLDGGYTAFAIIRKNNDNVVLRKGVENNGMILKNTEGTKAEIESDGRVITLFLDGQKKQADTESSSLSAGSSEKFSITRKEVAEKLSNVNSVMKAVMINPYERDGKFIGYRLSRMKPDSALLKLGLMSGDVLIRLNGKGLKDPAIFFDALSNTENLSALTLDIERSNVKKTLYVEIK